MYVENLAKRVMGDKFVWFTDKEDPLKKLRNVIVLLPPEKETKYSRIYWRTLDIWKYVLQHYEGYDWVCGWNGIRFFIFVCVE